jgi:hypothetical protein
MRYESYVDHSRSMNDHDANQAGIGSGGFGKNAEQRPAMRSQSIGDGTAHFATVFGKKSGLPKRLATYYYSLECNQERY